ncbi:ABC transporter ATP-binding protein [Amycolatopsis sp. H20-H5]|uniref:ABC transporter ATP-binding protein n=1 Tax=Amycolatopsis sp. H20-H5 TaxID=3046309 RepID=UPI002DBC5C95|nr:ABC transporter ATP-binding protein [Amycolatopsis sp. H20-H5]MEC3974155.1 ABC transporter ATP-binding protein [Amycolatopsis sp. H20-H5]
MQVRADRVSLEGPHGTLLPPTSLTVSAGQFAIAHGEPGVGITAFGLALAGRMKPTTGHVTLDGETASLRELVAVVDAPGVSEPDDALSLRVVVGEELALAHLPAGKDDVAQWLAAQDLSAFASTRFENIEPALRTRLLSTLAASRPGVRVLVLDTPDRHTSDVDSWARLAREHAERGLAVVVLSATTPFSALPHPPARVGELEQPEPLQCQPVPVDVETAPLEADTIAEGDQA